MGVDARVVLFPRSKEGGVAVTVVCISMGETKYIHRLTSEFWLYRSVSLKVRDADGKVAYNNTTVKIYSSISTITAVFKTYFVIFEESGLPVNTKWYANLTNGQTHSAVGKL